MTDDYYSNTRMHASGFILLFIKLDLDNFLANKN